MWGTTAGATLTAISDNTFFDGGSYVAKNTGLGSMYFQNLGAHHWRTFPTVSAGANQTATDRMQLNAAGNLIIGGGITLGNGQTYSAANTISDYETGTYSVALQANSGAYPTIASGALYGEYTKIGRLCHVIIGGNAVTLSGTTSGLIGFTLPFVPAGSNTAGNYGGGGFVGSGVTFVRTTHALCTNIGSRLGILTQTNGGGWNWETNAVFGNGANWRMTCTYQTA